MHSDFERSVPVQPISTDQHSRYTQPADRDPNINLPINPFSELKKAKTYKCINTRALRRSLDRRMRHLSLPYAETPV